MTSVKVIVRKTKGGPGSGNWGHSGRPGQVGGSSPGGGKGGSALEPQKFNISPYVGMEESTFASKHPQLYKEYARGLRTAFEVASLTGKAQTYAKQVIKDMGDELTQDFKFYYPHSNKFVKPTSKVDRDILGNLYDKGVLAQHSDGSYGLNDVGKVVYNTLRKVTR